MKPYSMESLGIGFFFQLILMTFTQVVRINSLFFFTAE